MNDILALLSTGNNPLIAAAAVVAGWFVFLRNKTPQSVGLAGWLGANKATLLGVATTVFQNREQLLGFVGTFLSNVKSLFVKAEEKK